MAAINFIQYPQSPHLRALGGFLWQDITESTSEYNVEVNTETGHYRHRKIILTIPGQEDLEYDWSPGLPPNKANQGDGQAR